MFSQAIDTFLAVTRSGSLSAAADELNLTQTTISKRIKALEDELGMQLFERGRGMRQVRLTPSGEEFMKLAEQWNLLSREARILGSRGPALSLTIGAVDSLNVFVLPRLYRELHEHSPALRMEIRTLHSDEMYTQIDQRQLDLAFTLRHRTVGNVQADVFFSTPMVVLSLATRPRARISTVHPSDLAPESELFIPWGRSFQAWHERWWDPLAPSRIRLDSGHLILQMLQHPGQWSIVPLWLARAAQKNGPYVIRELSDSPPPYVCYRLTHKHPTTNTRHAIAVVEEHCRRLFGNLAGQDYLG